MGGIVNNREIVLSCELGVVSCRVKRVSGTEEPAFVKTVQTVFDHFASKFFIVDSELSVREEIDCLSVI